MDLGNSWAANNRGLLQTDVANNAAGGNNWLGTASGLASGLGNMFGGGGTPTRQDLAGANPGYGSGGGINDYGSSGGLGGAYNPGYGNPPGGMGDNPYIGVPNDPGGGGGNWGLNNPGYGNPPSYEW
jgi:hypothetical protein